MAVFLAILFLILLLLASPVSLSVRLEQEWQVVLRYLFLSFRLWPQKEKKEKAETETEEKEKEKDEKKAGKKALLLDTLKRRSIPGLLNLLSEAASLAVSVLKRFLSHVHVSKFDLLPHGCGGRCRQCGIAIWQCLHRRLSGCSRADGCLPLFRLRRQRRAGFSKKGNRSSFPVPRAHLTVFYHQGGAFRIVPVPFVLEAGTAGNAAAIPAGDT